MINESFFVNFRSILSEFNSEGYTPLFINIKKEVMDLLFKHRHDFIS